MQVSGARAAAVAVATAVGLSAACSPGDPNKPPPPRYRLEGSVTQVMDLGYDEARLQTSFLDVKLLFVRRRPLNAVDDGGTGTGASEDYPLMVTYSLEDGGIFQDKRVDLTELTAAGTQRGLVSRNVLNDPRRSFPALNRGTLYLGRGLLDQDGIVISDAVVSGDFHVTFENGIEAASGRTIFGNFDAKVAQ